VKLEGHSCGGCKLSLSATTLEKVREDMEIVACENCSRILYSESS
jgi:predicted  nucleic acid-binding Zn-ribbon protein